MTILISVAMEEEAQPFLDLADDVASQWTVAGKRVWQLDLGGQDVVLIQSGIGLVNAAVAATALMESVSPSVLISAGTAGGLGADITVGDVVIGTEYAYTQADVRVFDYALGQLPGMPERFAADPTLANSKALSEVPGYASALAHHGLVASGDAFVSGSHADAAREGFPEALACDMESTALAHTAYLFGVSFVSIRGISDLVDAGEFAERAEDAAERSAAVVCALLKAL